MRNFFMRRGATDRVGFEPTVPLRAHRFSRPAVSTAHAPVLTSIVADKVGFEPTKRLPVYTLSRRVPSAARPLVPRHERSGPGGLDQPPNDPPYVRMRPSAATAMRSCSSER